MQLADGTEVPADLVIVGIGVIPNVDLARACGLNIDNGIVVDEHLRTSDPDVFGAGDVANAYHPFLGKHLRVEHWANALHQPASRPTPCPARTASTNGCRTSTPTSTTSAWSTPATSSPRTTTTWCSAATFDRQFIAFWLRDGRVLAGMNVNVWDVTETIKHLVQSAHPVNTDDLANPAVPLTSLLQRPASPSLP